ncbi:glutathione S-transferase [Lophiotrema nucula]|uniref:Glutathione S-transferase n=1 Tax=Lophiotrema nucula TaxID=690887 RepID=A0A6A5YI04_9PLEO|nr:glutathione S-transferase [Lophiotrema nucula]
MSETSHPTGLVATKGIELLTFGTPNGFKVSILLEELKAAYPDFSYTVQSIDIFQDVNKQAWFTALSPNGKIPIIVDHDRDGFAVFEGLAILSYLTRVHDPECKFHFEDLLEASEAEQWIAWQHGGLGSIQAQANLFYRFHPERYAFPTQRYVGEVERLYGVLDKRLDGREYVAGPGTGRYSIADIALFPFIDAAAVTGIEIERWPNLYAWWERVGERPAVQKGMSVPSGEYFRFGYKKVKKMWKDDPEGVEERERPLREALEDARRDFGSVG